LEDYHDFSSQPKIVVLLEGFVEDGRNVLVQRVRFILEQFSRNVVGSSRSFVVEYGRGSSDLGV
jgi:hypothetical protein